MTGKWRWSGYKRHGIRLRHKHQVPLGWREPLKFLCMTIAGLWNSCSYKFSFCHVPSLAGESVFCRKQINFISRATSFHSPRMHRFYVGRHQGLLEGHSGQILRRQVRKVAYNSSNWNLQTQRLLRLCFRKEVTGVQGRSICCAWVMGWVLQYQLEEIWQETWG